MEVNKKGVKKSGEKIKKSVKKSSRKSRSKKEREEIGDNQPKITSYFEREEKKYKKIYGYNPETDEWHCTLCGENMGRTNSRQLCGKYYCYNEE